MTCWSTVRVHERLIGLALANGRPVRTQLILVLAHSDIGRVFTVANLLHVFDTLADDDAGGIVFFIAFGELLLNTKIRCLGNAASTAFAASCE